MSTEFLPLFTKNAVLENEELVPDLLAGRLDHGEALTFCANFRIAGIADLFLTADPDGLQRFLAASGRAYGHQLTKLDPARKRTSRALPLFDALAAGDLDGAAAIARAATHTWVPDDEYEEDFLFLEWVMQRHLLDAPKASTDALLVRWEACLQGADDPRLDVCRALEAMDADAFDSALDGYLRERQALYAERADNDSIAPEVTHTEGAFSVEGAALLRIADRLKLPTARDYPTVPSMAREPLPAGLSPDAWRTPLNVGG